MSLEPPDGLDPLTRQAVLTALRRGDTIEAIKIYRAATGAPFLGAKSAVELLRDPGPVAARPRRSYTAAFFIFLLLALALLPFLIRALMR